MGRPRLDSARVSCNITKEAAKRLDQLMDEIYFAGKTGWQDPNFTPLFERSNRQSHRPMGRKPVGLVLSRLIMNPSDQMVDEIIKEIVPQVHTEKVQSGEPQHWKLSKYGGGLFRNSDTQDGSSGRKVTAYDGFVERELPRGFLQARRKKRMSIAEEVRKERDRERKRKA
jgi:hypothetical protein